MKFFLISALLSAGVYANTPEEQGRITFLQVHKAPDSTSDSGNRFIVSLNGEISENPCGGDQWSGYLTSETGNAQYSMLLSAAISGKEVKIEGNANFKCEGKAMLIRNIYLLF